MAIQFLNSLELNYLEVKELRIENLASAPGSGNLAGNVLYNTTLNKFGYYNGTQWVYLATDVVGTANGTYIDVSNTGTTNAPTITADLSATGTPDATKYLRGDNTWSLISGIYAWDIAGDTGSETIVNGDTVTFAGGTNVTTAYDTGTNTLTINSTDQFTGTVTSITAGVGLTGGVITTSGTITLDYDGTDNYILANPNGSATVESVSSINFNHDADDNVYSTELGDIPVDALTLVKTYIDNATAGGLIYQGGYNASTNTPDLTTSPNSIEKGWTYTVTADGTFFGEQLRVGDVLIAEIDNPTNLTNWTTVQNNIDLATAGTDATAVRGIAGFSSTDFTVSSTGFVELVAAASSKSIKVVLNSANSGVSVATAGGVTTYTIDVSNASIFGATATADNIMVEVIEVSSGSTVYVESVRASANVGLKFLTSPGEGDYYALLHNVA
jgi:hypothetical protein